MSIGARSQSAKTYLEKHYESFSDCPSFCASPSICPDSHECSGSLEDLIRHGLHALRETLQQDKALNPLNTSIGILGPASTHEKDVPSGGSFRILEGDVLQPFLDSMIPKEVDAPAAPPADPAAPAPVADEDVQMTE
jgi:20S proteasome subunit alpha 6